MKRVKTIEKFQKHIEKTVNEFLDQLEDGENNDSFDLIIAINGKQIALPFHADLCSRLETLLDEERIENEL